MAAEGKITMMTELQGAIEEKPLDEEVVEVVEQKPEAKLEDVISSLEAEAERNGMNYLDGSESQIEVEQKFRRAVL